MQSPQSEFFLKHKMLKQPNDIKETDIVQNVQLNYKKKFKKGGDSLKGSKETNFGCVGRVWGGEHCVAMERVKKAKNLQNMFRCCINLVQKSRPLDNITTSFVAPPIHTASSTQICIGYWTTSLNTTYTKMSNCFTVGYRFGSTLENLSHYHTNFQEKKIKKYWDEITWTGNV